MPGDKLTDAEKELEEMKVLFEIRIFAFDIHSAHVTLPWTHMHTWPCTLHMFLDTDRLRRLLLWKQLANAKHSTQKLNMNKLSIISIASVDDCFARFLLTSPSECVLRHCACWYLPVPQFACMLLSWTWDLTTMVLYTPTYGCWKRLQWQIFEVHWEIQWAQHCLVSSVEEYCGFFMNRELVYGVKYVRWRLFSHLGRSRYLMNSVACVHLNGAGLCSDV